MKKRWIGILFCFLLFLLTGCGANVKVQTLVHPDGSGTRNFSAMLPNDQFQYLKGGEDALNKALQENTPSGMKFTRTKKTEGVEYLWQMDFSSIDDLNNKSKVLLGRNPEITMSVEGNPFNKRYLLDDKWNSSDYFQWAKDVISKNGLLTDPNNMQHVIDSSDSQINMPGFGQEYKPKYSRQTQSREVFPVESIQLQTDIKNKPMTRTLILSVTKDVNDAITKSKKEAVTDFLKNILKDGEVTSQEKDDRIEYTLKLKGNDFSSLLEQSKFFSREQGTYSNIKKSNFFPIDQLHENVDIGTWLGEGVAKQDFTYKLLFNGKSVRPDGTEIQENGKPVAGDITIQQKSPQFNVDYYIKVTTMMFYITLVIGILFAITLIGLLIWLIRKKPEMWKKITTPTINLSLPSVEIELSSPEEHEIEGDRFCHSCGTEFHREDLFCYQCGEDREIKKGA